MGRPDHPRACGANVSGLMETWCRVGSSPRVRGKQIYKLGVFTCSRIIPARAGQTSSRDPPPPVFVRSIPARAGQTVSPRIQTTCPSDHPRACGANIEHLERQQRKYGSSPRVRGKLRGQPKPASPHRIIPARAGQTLSSFLRMCWDSDHPRACGANASYGYRGGCLRGSSPRVRGKQREGAELRLSGRIIPARAGQTARRSTRRRTSPDHPRACGANAAIGGGYPRFGSSPRVRGKQQFEVRGRLLDRIIPARGANQLNIQLDVWQSGSSPRVRGKLWVDVFGAFCCRIIPARAGQTHSRQPSSRRLSDHPRACGANSLSKTCMFPLSGSSPRVRGKLAYARRRRRPVRIIPARAGQTRPPHTDWLSRPDHPRACGANYLTALIVFIAIGSSPRVRGKPRGLAAGQRGGRIIPARAGQTSPCCPHAIGSSDHPRACGANVVVSECHDCVSGSSPRVRGKLDGMYYHLLEERIIPARAGQT